MLVAARILHSVHPRSLTLLLGCLLLVPGFGSEKKTCGNQESRIRVAIYDGRAATPRDVTALEAALAGQDDFVTERVSPESIQAGVLERFDVEIQPGGGVMQAGALGDKGRVEIRKLVERGGGFLGFCAGAYIMTADFPTYLQFFNARTVDPKNRQRGTGMLKIRLTEEGRKILGDRDGSLEIRYGNGPVIEKANRGDLPPFTTLALFETEMTRAGAKEGLMVNTPAIYSAEFGKGRVMGFAVHPELTPGLEEFVRIAVRWAVRRLK